jgi:hypothetical protein
LGGKKDKTANCCIYWEEKKIRPTIAVEIGRKKNIRPPIAVYIRRKKR